MYAVNVEITGTAPLMQHRFPMPEPGDTAKGATRSTGAKDYTQEWHDYFYETPDAKIFQPAAHIEGAMVKAATSFKIQGKRGKTYKDLFRAAVFVTPDQIPHNVDVPASLDADADKPLYIDIRPVVVQRSRVVRMRPCFKAGWKLAFAVEVIDDTIHPELVHDILTLAGKTVGIGDFRPKFGRFMVTNFQVVE